MSWLFVGRTEQIDRIRAVLDARPPGPILIVGERGVGRSALLSRALERLDLDRDQVIMVSPAGGAPLAALRPHLKAEISEHGLPGEAVSAAARALADQAAGRRLVVAVDDVHLLDHASVLALRMLSREGAAVVLATCVAAEGDARRRPDPTDALRYEPGMLTITLPPLRLDEVAEVLAGVVDGPVYPATAEAFHLVSGGNPRLLHELITRYRLGGCMVMRDGRWRMAQAPHRLARGIFGLGAAPDPGAGPEGAADSESSPPLVDAVQRAWRELAIDRVIELCRMAMWCGLREPVAAVWANVLLLRGRVRECARFLDSLPEQKVEGTPELALVKAMTLAFGLGSSEAVDDFLLPAAWRGVDLRNRLLAYRAWILAVSGQVDKAMAGLAAVDRSDRETAVFVHATWAAITIGTERANDAVFHLRRAIATAQSCPTVPPWMLPFLTASLIDAMLIAGRVGEAIATANELNDDAGGDAGGDIPGSGWDVAVALSALVSGRWLRPNATTEARIA